MLFEEILPVFINTQLYANIYDKPYCICLACFIKSAYEIDYRWYGKIIFLIKYEIITKMTSLARSATLGDTSFR